MTSRDVPEDWWDLLGRADMTDPRSGAPSMSALSRHSGVHPSTISAMMYGDRKTSGATVDRVVDAIAERSPRRDPREIRARVYDLVGRALGVPVPFEPHPDANLLTLQERNAVNELIRLLAAPKKGVQRPLSVAPAEVPDAVAAYEEEGSIAGEQEESDTP